MASTRRAETVRHHPPAAQSRADKNNAESAKIEILIIGDPSVTAETTLQVIGVRPDVDRSWHITKVTHYMDTQGYETTIEGDLGAGGAGGGGTVPLLPPGAGGDAADPGAF